MSKERLIVNEVIIVGELRKDKANIPITTLLVDGQGVALVGAPYNEALAKLKAEVRAKFKFIRDTNISQAGLDKGLKNGPFFQLRMADPGGETRIIGGKTLKISRKTNKFSYDNLFERGNSITFQEVKEEIVAGKWEIVGLPEEGIIRLTEYGLMGFWDEFPLGFDAYQMVRNATTGAMERFQSTTRLDDGTYNKKDAVINTGRHFIYESEVENVEALRDVIRRNAEKYKVPKNDLVDPNSPTRGEAPKKEEPKPAADPKKDDV